MVSNAQRHRKESYVFKTSFRGEDSLEAGGRKLRHIVQASFHGE
jgi:hypothetical protein